MLNKQRTIFSLSPRYFEMRDAVLQLKNVLPFTPDAARASIVLPVPGGPKRSTPLRDRGKGNYQAGERGWQKGKAMYASVARVARIAAQQRCQVLRYV